MEMVVTRRRTSTAQRLEYPLVYQLVILLRSHKEMKVVVTNVGVAMRSTILCDLALGGLAVLGPDGTVKTERAPVRELEKEFVYKIEQCHYDVKHLFRALNGELSKDLAVKNLRSRVYREMAARGIIQIHKTLVYKKIVLTDFEAWNVVYGRLLGECRGNSLSIESKILLVCLNYVNRMESLLLQCNETDAACVMRCLDDTRQRIKSGAFSVEDGLVYRVLEGLVR